MAAAAFFLAPGLALGSFLNVVAARLPERRSVVRPPSTCTDCGVQISWYDNVPVLSWLALRGRCRSCGAAISWIYPAVELATGLLIAGCVWHFGVTWEAAVASAFCAALVTVSAIDLKHRIVPNRIVVPGAVAILLAQTAIHPSPEWLLAALGAAGFLLGAAIVYPAGMGMGDVKLALLLGAMLGRTVAPAMFIAMVAALVPSVVLFARHGAAARKMGVPFAPFLAFGAVIALFAGDALLDAYLGLMNH